MAAPVVLAIDQGTTNTKALLVDPEGAVLARASRAMTLDYPRPGWAEQSADVLWDSVAGAIADLVAAAPDCDVAALAISNQRETVVLWDAASGQAVTPAVSWQCRRSSERCAALRDAGHEAEVVSRSGLGLDPLFPAAKLAWLLDSVPDGHARAAAGDVRAGTIDSWLLWRLTGGTVHATDHGNASRTQLLNIHDGCWDPALAAIFDVPLAMLPEVRSSDSLFGHVAAGTTGLPEGVPIHAVMGDSHAALFGHGITTPSASKATIGTGTSVMTITGGPSTSKHGLSSTIAWSRGGVPVHALEGNVTVSGQAIAFATRLLGTHDEHALSQLAQSVPNTGGVVFVPALAGLGAPHWQDRARGLVHGLTLATAPAHVARAAFEAVSFQIHDVVRAMEADLGRPMSRVQVDGGATRNDFLLQLLADALDRPVLRKPQPEASALGAARMAAEGLGWAAMAAPPPQPEDRFVPRIDPILREARLAEWRAGVRRAAPDL